MDILVKHLTEFLVGGMLILFGIGVRAWVAQVTSSVDRVKMSIDKAATRIENVTMKVHALEVMHSREIAKIDAHVSNIYKRLDREGLSVAIGK